MKNKSTVKRVFALVLVIAFLGAFVIGTLSARAANYTDKGFTMLIGGTEPISFPSGTITNISSGSPTVVSISSYSGGTAHVYAQGLGIAYIYVTVKNTSNLYDYYTIPVTVSSSTSTPTPTSTSASSISLSVGSTYSIGSFPTINSYSSTNNSVAIVSELSGRLTILGIAAGSCTIHYQVRDVYGVLTSGSVSVSVYGSNTATPTATYTTATPTATPSGSTMNLTAGKRYVTSTSYYSIESVTVDNSSVATASSDSLGRIVIDAKSSGTTTIRYSYKTSSAGSTYNSSFTITVSGTATQSPSTYTPSGSGISFKSKNVNVKLNKSYKIGTIYLNGDQKVASDLLWLSSNPDVITVNSSTGVFKCVGTGTAKLVAVDKDCQYMNYVTVNVTD